VSTLRGLELSMYSKTYSSARGVPCSRLDRNKQKTPQIQ
jgi:hypothetical protein